MSEKEGRTRQRTQPFTRTALLLIASLVVGLGAGFGPRLWRDNGVAAKSSQRFDREYSVQRLRLPTSGRALSETELRARLNTKPSGPTTTSQNALAAVTTFLDAQIASDQTTAYSTLSSQDQNTYQTAAMWRELRQGVLPDVVNYTAGEVSFSTATTATVAVQLGLRPALDETIGLVPASAKASIHAVFERDSWRVAMHRSEVAFVYLSDASLSDAAQTWVRARQACKVDQQWRSTMYGEGAEFHAKALCKRRGNIEVSTPQALSDRSDTEAFIAAFGPKVGLWARVVSVGAPAEFDLVLAPVDQQWLVVGVLLNPSSLGQG